MKKLMILAALALGVYGYVSAADKDGCCPSSTAGEPCESEMLRGSLLENRLWTNQIPKGPRDLTLQLGLVSRSGRNLGAVGQSSAWRLHLDRLRWSTKGNKLTLEFPQDQTKVTVQYKVYKCQKESPKPFDLCLDLVRGKNKVTLYSRKGLRGAEVDALELDDIPPAAPDVHYKDVAPLWLR